MWLVFNKEFRDEEKIISALIKKIKNSKTVHQYVFKNTEKYSFDGFDISFETVEHKFVVTDKDGKKVVSMNCSFNAYDEMQEVRSNWFYELENVARKRNKKELEKESEKEDKKSKWKSGIKALFAANKLKQQQAKRNAKTLEKIRSL
jgi:hypothetical protein